MRRCIKTILGISNQEQWAKRITCTEIRRKWGDCETASDKITKRRLQWLGHLARTRIPKATFFGWLCQPRPRSGPKRRWKGIIQRDLNDISMDENEWYDEATTSRAAWRASCGLGLENYREQTTTEPSIPVVRQVTCEVCSGTFR